MGYCATGPRRGPHEATRVHHAAWRRAGLIESLARPGGRFTGLSLLTPETSGKRLELLAETVRDLARVALLLNPGNLSNFVFLEETQAAAHQLGIALQPLEVRNPSEI